MFLSVDIDVCDPGHAPGTGTPEPGGLTARQLLDSVRRIAYELPVVGVDVVEVSPPYDQAEITSFLANRVVLEALSGDRATAPRRRGRHDLGSDAAAARRPPRQAMNDSFTSSDAMNESFMTFGSAQNGRDRRNRGQRRVQAVADGVPHLVA